MAFRRVSTPAQRFRGPRRGGTSCDFVAESAEISEGEIEEKRLHSPAIIR